MAVTKGKLTTKVRGRGRPPKEESNALLLEKNLLEFKTNIIGIIPDAYKTLQELMLDKDTKPNIRENIARYVIEEGKQMLSDYFDEENEEIEEAEGKVSKVEDKPYKPFTTDIISFGS